MRIFLIGFMGSGKTHWGTRIAEKLKIPFYDLDAVIVNREGMNISEIFSDQGGRIFPLYGKTNPGRPGNTGRKFCSCRPEAEHLVFSIILNL